MSDGDSSARSARPAAFSREAIINMSQEEYRNLDIRLFVLLNLGRYTGASITVHREVYTSYEPDEICNHLYEFAFPEVKKKHAMHLDYVGEERTKLLFSVLKFACNTIAPKKLAKMYAVRHERRSAVDADHLAIHARGYDSVVDDDQSLGDDFLLQATGGDASPAHESMPASMPAAECVMPAHEINMDSHQPVSEPERHRLNSYINLARAGHITPREAQVLELAVLDQMSNSEIARVCGGRTTRSSIGATRSRTRSKLRRLLADSAEELQAKFRVYHKA